MNPECLTAMLAKSIMGWKVAPDRYLTGSGSWIPKWKFNPLEKIDDAFRLLEKAASTFKLATTPGGTFTARVRVGDHTASASGKSKATVITVAVARAVGIDVPDGAVPSSVRIGNSRKGEGRKR